MDLSKVPLWAWGVGGAVALIALVQSHSSGSGATVTTVGPVANPNASADLSARVTGFNALTGFATGLVNQQTTLAQTAASEQVSLAGLAAQTAQATTQANSQATIANINAQTEQARIAAAQTAAATQGANQLAATRSQAKSNTFDNIVRTAGSVIGTVLKFL